MPRIVIAHAVQDVERWLGGKAERAAGAAGFATNSTDLVAMDRSNHAAVAFDVDDVDAFKALLSSVPPGTAAEAESRGAIMAMTACAEA